MSETIELATIEDARQYATENGGRYYVLAPLPDNVVALLNEQGADLNSAVA